MMQKEKNVTKLLSSLITTSSLYNALRITRNPNRILYLSFIQEKLINLCLSLSS